ncbi:MAG: HAMP domain-containing protein [Alphaproteobacteria bacterium]|uniref:Oxygen sensor histidine kinase NreB n=1 Tax=Candidatus Nitrobium versatile TaxID=2884831 RepID=A0A953M3B8_9BACT|nr:HAMP domain-containing protein [Candidatus Nitrobium versatile]
MRRKILVAIILNVVAIATTLGIISYITVRESIERSLQNRIMLARTIANYLEILLQENLNRLYDISLSGKIDLKDAVGEPEKKALETAYRYSLFSDGVFLLDKYGNEILSYPLRDTYAGNLSHIEYVSQVLRTGRPLISGVYTIEPIKKPVLFALVPLRDKEGNSIGVAGGILSPTNPFLTQILQSVNREQNSYVEVIDFNERVISSDIHSHVLQHHDHEDELGRMIRTGQAGIKTCRHRYSQPALHDGGVDLLAFVPLKTAPWGVIVGQAEEDIYAPSTKLRKTFSFLIVVFIAASVIFAIGASRGIVRPLKQLTAVTDRIAAGDLSTPVGPLGSDEILVLSRSFETMRQRLTESLEEIRNHTADLEHRVAQRTEQIRESRQKVELLLKKGISSQEEERRRIARELHDEILQDLSAFLINLDICRLSPGEVGVEKIDAMRALVLKTIDGIHTVIQNLRPTVLDDLGLEAAIGWLLEKHLREKGVMCSLLIENRHTERFPSQVEIALFRTIQESVINIARHAKAGSVSVSLKTDEHFVSVIIEDDGVGFELQEVLLHAPEDGRGLGILGMSERVALLDGKFQIYSTPGEGTKIVLRVPFCSPGGENV